MSKKKPAKIAFSKRRIEALQPPKTGRKYHYDSKTPGLCCCVTAKGNKSFYCYRWTDGRPQRVLIGKFPDVTVAQAQDKAKKINADLANGVDPTAGKKAARQALTVQDLFDDWMRYAKAEKKTWKEDERKYNKFLSHWSGRRLSDIKPEDVERLQRSVATKSKRKGTDGRYQANRVLELVKAMFNRAIEKKSWSGPNPAQHVRKYKEQDRARFLGDVEQGEIKRLFDALNAEPDELMRDFFYVCLMTGARRGNVQAMRWDQVNLSDMVWHIPETKNGRPVVVPLPDMAVDILKRRQETRNGSAWVFPGTGKTGHITEPKRRWASILKRAGIEDLRVHDLRRTLGSWMAIGNVSSTIIGAALGHASNSRATAVYARLQIDPVRQSVQQATGQLLIHAGMLEDKTKKTKKRTTKKRRTATSKNT